MHEIMITLSPEQDLLNKVSQNIQQREQLQQQKHSLSGLLTKDELHKINWSIHHLNEEINRDIDLMHINNQQAVTVSLTEPTKLSRKRYTTQVSTGQLYFDITQHKHS